ncbi:hypothetical protein [Pseudonocardia endophytica]|uniref:hypothetical protein n=1 Tax=Pseudonocardia endophytica TaxID=401976 RepID=UPI001046FB24|nr:hypothetical protein [Pseudonocardia endophytica]
MDLATVFAALDLDPDDPDAADDVAVVHALVARRDSSCPRRGAGGSVRAVTGPQITHVDDRCRANGPEVRWSQ